MRAGMDVGYSSCANFEGEAYRVADYAAYFRYVKCRLEREIQNGERMGHIQSQWRTATCAGGFASAMGSGARMIICR